ncbi:hypothetical protein [Actinoplanes teichomyceticus]|nr:hypothetical protein [Actinoplanes teichomyceticus]
MLAETERRSAAGRDLSRLDRVGGNRRLRECYRTAGYTVVGELPPPDAGPGGRHPVVLPQKRLRPG